MVSLMGPSRSPTSNGSLVMSPLEKLYHDDQTDATRFIRDNRGEPGTTVVVRCGLAVREWLPADVCLAVGDEPSQGFVQGVERTVRWRIPEHLAGAGDAGRTTPPPPAARP